MKKQTGNTEVQINEEGIGKLPEKEFRIMIVKMVKKKKKTKKDKNKTTLKTKQRKCKNQLTNT